MSIDCLLIKYNNVCLHKNEIIAIIIKMNYIFEMKFFPYYFFLINL